MSLAGEEGARRHPTDGAFDGQRRQPCHLEPYHTYEINKRLGDRGQAALYGESRTRIQDENTNGDMTMS